MKRRDFEKIKKISKMIAKIRLGLPIPLNTSQFAKELGLHRAVVSQWERATGGPNIENILKIEAFCKERNIPFDRDDFF